LVDYGIWKNARWEMYLSTEMPDPALCATVACVAIADIERPAVVLGFNRSRLRWEVQAGHTNPLDPSDPEGRKEAPVTAMRRETPEEGGFVVAQFGLFGHRKIFNFASASTPQSGRTYDEITYMPCFWATTDEPLREPTDDKVTECRPFDIDEMKEKVREGSLLVPEFKLIQWGIAAARHDLGLRP
jgi:8-oxo-dGTP pyrophosphatase MutT (NUDIX family)